MAQSFHYLVVREQISVLPCFIDNISEGIERYLSNKILKYSSDFNGVLVFYYRPTLLHNKGKILDEHPHIHFDVSYTAYIFKPVIGSTLFGTVSNIVESSDKVVGCLLYDCIHVTVISTRIKWHRNDFEVGSSIRFRLRSLEVTRDGALLLTGEYLGTN